MKKQGISLLVLIITIVVIIILATAIIVNLANTNIIGNANEAVLKQDIANLQSELEVYISDKYVNKKGKYDRIKLNADENTATYGTETIKDENNDKKSNIYDILNALKKSKWDKKVYIHEGNLVFKKSGLTDDEVRIILGMGLEVDGMPKLTSITTESTYTSVKVTLNVTLSEDVEKYIYILNDGENEQREESTELTKEYTGLTPGINYGLKVILVLKDGTEIPKEMVISTKNIDGELTYKLNEEEWTSEKWTSTDVKVTIEYSEETMPEGYELQYRIKNANGSEAEDETQEWNEYKETLVVTSNNTIVMGRLYNDKLDGGDAKLESSINISNIDREIPTAPSELYLTSEKDYITAEAKGSTDAISGVDYYEYSIDNETWQTEEKFTGLEMGEYTIYARAVDRAGNVSDVKTGTVEVKIQINISVEYVDLLNAKVNIDYGNATNPEYKIGTNGEWQTYENEFTINSQDIIENKLYNEDYTLTVCARGTSSNGLQGTVDTIIDGIDLQVPEAPVITSSGSNYPIITEYGVGITGIVSITYPENVKKLYSLDGENWQEYIGEFESDAIKVYAKSVKESGLETSVETSMSGSLASDALDGEAYDEYDNTYARASGTSNKIIYVSEEMKGKKIYLITSRINGGSTILSYDSNGVETTIATLAYNASSITNLELDIPSDCKYLKFKPSESNGHINIYDIKVMSEPVITNTKYYPIITENGITSGYNEVEISYFSTSVQKLYKIGTDGEWQTYSGKIILEIGDTVYAKGIDENNNETRVVSEYTAALPSDALDGEAYDEYDNTYARASGTSNKIIYVSEEMQGKKIYLITSRINGGSTILSYDSNGVEKTIATLAYNASSITNLELDIPSDCKYLKFKPSESNGYINIYDISVSQ